MRSLPFLTVLVAIAACSDDNQLTSPTDGSTQPTLASPRLTNAVMDASKDPPAAKPIDQVGFTKVFTVTASTFTSVPWDANATITATCPAASVPIGGSWQLANVWDSDDLHLVDAFVNDANGWTMRVLNTHSNLAAIPARVRVVCIQ